MKKTPAQKIRDYLKLPKSESFKQTKKEKYGRNRR